jgi:hypothetical protein
MAVGVTVELLAGTFRGRAGDQTATTWPPSPVRLIGALLNGAHNLDGGDYSPAAGRCALARQALSVLVSAPPPVIVTPEEPIELASGTAWYAARSGDDKALKELVEMPRALASANRVGKPRTVSLLPVGSSLRYYIDADIHDENQWGALSAAARAVPFFGSSMDHAQITVDRIDTRPEPMLGEHVWGPASDSSRRSMRSLRTWTPETLAWFDDVHRAGGESVADWRISTTPYTHLAPTPRAEFGGGSPDFHMLTLGSPITLRDYAERVSTVSGWNGMDVLPAVEFNAPDKVRGFGLYGPGTAAALNSAPPNLVDGADFPGSFVSWERSTWVGPSKRWQSATPSAAHRDARVARIQLDAELRQCGLRLTEMSPRPVRRWHSSKLCVPANYGLWFITAECEDPQGDPIAGPVRAGACISSGAGLLTPC